MAAAREGQEGGLGPGDDPGPVVDLPRSGPSPLIIAFGLGLAGLGLFAFLEGRREQQAPHALGPTSRETAPGPSAPPLEIPPPPPVEAGPPPQPQIQYVERPAPPPPPPIIRYVDRPTPSAPPALPPSPPVVGRANEPPLVIDLGEAVAPGGAGGDDATAKAVVLRNRSFLVPQGTLVAAVLETPIDSTRPGLVRALTTADTRGFDGTRILIPRGSRLVGDYKSDVQSGQKRVVVTWNRLVRPDGVAIKLASPGSDTLGGAGVEGAVNNHILTRITSAVLQSVLTIGVNVASNPGNGSVVVGSPAQGITGAGQSIIPTQDLKPTITVREGATISVFVSRDLDFAGALPRS